MGYFTDIINDARRPSADAFTESSWPPATAEEWASPAAGLDPMAESAPSPREGVEPEAAISALGETRKAGQPVGPVRQTMPSAIMDDKGPTEFVAAYSIPARPDEPRSDGISDLAPGVATAGDGPESSGTMRENEQVHFGTETAGHQPVQAAADAPAAKRFTYGRDPGTAPKRSAAGAVVKDEGQALPRAESSPVEPWKREEGYDSVDGYVPRTRTKDTLRSSRNAESGTGDADQTAQALQYGIATRPTAAGPREAPKVCVESRLVTSAPAATEIPPVPRLPDVRQATAADSEPRVHIGRIDIVVLAPEPARHAQPPMSETADLASRHYLRRL